MRSLIGLLVFLLILAGLAYAGMWALDTYVKPEPRELTIDIPLDRVLDSAPAPANDPYSQGTVRRQPPPTEDASPTEEPPLNEEAPAAQ